MEVLGFRNLCTFMQLQGKAWREDSVRLSPRITREDLVRRARDMRPKMHPDHFCCGCCDGEFGKQ